MIMAAWGRSGDPHLATPGQSSCAWCGLTPDADLDGKCIQLTDYGHSTVFMAGEEGLEHCTAWAGAGDGVLFYDTDGDNAISDIREYVFTEWDPTAKDDLAALRSRFDTNGDGKLTGTEMTGFKVMKTNADGSLTAVTLASRGIIQINVTQDATQIALPDGSQITGQATFMMGQGNRVWPKRLLTV